MRDQLLNVFLCGDVMTGRGIDQALPCPGNHVLFESYIRDARDYVELAERLNGPIERPVDFKYIWGDALAEMEQSVGSRIINLETSITHSNDCWPDKGIHYRMSPLNIGCLTAANINCCCLANNHVLDWGYAGLAETIQTLDAVGIFHAGAGRNATEAAAPAIFKTGNKRVLLFSFGSVTSGIPREWAATDQRAGVNLLEDLSILTAQRIAGWMKQYQTRGDVVIASIHWGGNWGYEIPSEQIAFAHRLIEEGVSIVHGHSSHHIKAVEIYENRLVLYGCGDFITDYEGITGCEAFRGDLVLMYLIRVDINTGQLKAVRLVPMQMRRFRLKHASKEDADWICPLLNRLGEPFATKVQLAQDNSLVLGFNSSARS